jgi:hypothetical protein
MSPDAITQAVVSVVTPLITLITFFSRNKRLRSEIRENLSLLAELDKDEILKEHTPASFWLRGKIAIDVAKLSGQPLGDLKKPIPVGSVIFAGALCAGLSFLTYYIDRNSLMLYSLIPGVFAFLLAVSMLGMITNREILPPEESTESQSSGQAADAVTSTPRAEEPHSAPSNGVGAGLSPDKI